jgi:hypothetical protein
MVISLSAASTALASPASITLSGDAEAGYTPDSSGPFVEINATLSNGVAGGSLKTGSGGSPETYSHYWFTGNVTCMAVNGGQTVVGAVGTAHKSTPEHTEELPGMYAQVLTFEFGTFHEHSYAGRRVWHESFGMLGNYHQGLEGTEPPSCLGGYSFSQQYFPSYSVEFNHTQIVMSPSITSPQDGYVSHTGKVKFQGTGEPKKMVNVYEVGHEAGGMDVKVNSMGHWKLTLAGLSAGTHVFTASAVSGSTTPANTVEITVG